MTEARGRNLLSGVCGDGGVCPGRGVGHAGADAATASTPFLSLPDLILSKRRREGSSVPREPDPHPPPGTYTTVPTYTRQNGAHACRAGLPSLSQGRRPRPVAAQRTGRGRGRGRGRGARRARRLPFGKTPHPNPLPAAFGAARRAIVNRRGRERGPDHDRGFAYLDPSGASWPVSRRRLNVRRRIRKYGLVIVRCARMNQLTRPAAARSSSVIRSGRSLRLCLRTW